MRSFVSGVMAVAALLGGSSLTRATPIMLSLSSETPDLQNLKVGDTVRFDVSLSGLSSGESLDYLAGTVTFDKNLLGQAANVTPGAIILDPSGFVGSGFAGAADALYDSVFFSLTGTPISTNGIFFSFDVTAQQAGPGTVSFDSSSLAATDGNNSSIPLGAGAPLSYEVTPSTIAQAPEPGSLTLLVTAALGMGSVLGLSRAARGLRRRRNVSSAG